MDEGEQDVECAMNEVRDYETRKADTLALLATIREMRGWRRPLPRVPPLVPLTLAWADERVVIAVEGSSVTARNVIASGRARLAVGETNDVVMIDAILEKAVDVADYDALGAAYVAQADWDPRLWEGYVLLTLWPERVQAWRDENEIAERTLMRDGAWRS